MLLDLRSLWESGGVVDVTVVGGTVPSTGQVFPPVQVKVKVGADEEILDFVSNIVTAIDCDGALCREAHGTVVLTRGVVLISEVDRTVEMSPSLVRREVALQVTEPTSEIQVEVVLVRGIITTQNICRSMDETVILTRGVTVVVSTDRIVDMSSSLVRRELAVGVER